MQTLRNRKRHAGFTLLEILVVVVIIGVMAAAVVLNIGDKPGMARVKKAQADIASIESAIELYLMDTGRYPETLAALEPVHVKRLPLDPWSQPYVLQRPGTHGDLDIFSFGADGAPGGEGLDADIGNWQLR